MKNTLLKLTPYLIILAMDFYLLPLFMQNTGAAMLGMLCIMPLIAFITAMVYGIRRGFNLWLAILAGIMFLPTVFIYYNSSAWIYAPLYAVIVLLGNGAGRVFYKQR